MWQDFGSFNNWWCGPGAFFPGPFGMIITLLFWILIIVLVVKLFTSIFKKSEDSSTSALRILKERYAHGEISKEEFDRMKQALK